LNAHDSLVTQLLRWHDFGYWNGRIQDPTEAPVYCRKEGRPQLPHSVTQGSKCNFQTISCWQDLPPHHSTADWQPLKTKPTSLCLKTRFVPHRKDVSVINISQFMLHREKVAVFSWDTSKTYEYRVGRMCIS
jgi:hypothetical protein